MTTPACAICSLAISANKVSPSAPVADAAQMDKVRNREHYHLIVLDLMLPGEDGLSICRRLRGQGDRTPIVMLTAKGDEIDRILGLEMGADDYLPKPFNPRELLARINAVLRRQSSLPPGALEPCLKSPVSATSRLITPPAPSSAATAFPHHRRICRSQGAAAASRPTIVARQADDLGPGPASRAIRPGHRRADVAVAQADRSRPGTTPLPADRLGLWLHRAGRCPPGKLMPRSLLPAPFCCWRCWLDQHCRLAGLVQPHRRRTTGVEVATTASSAVQPDPRLDFCRFTAKTTAITG